ncbi:peptidoglycan DD-metalloendopeptidase family protein [Paenibacillus sp. GCM10027628]|uniref:peptidoglycan DD-metalloendopeptidase family protein n=1 Tax=Paenibacillus sp. GCM10027628 TaxID=3273413 RepID=UPI00363E5FB3
MKPRKMRQGNRTSLLYTPKYWLLLTIFCLLTASIVVYIGKQQGVPVPSAQQKDITKAAEQPTTAPIHRSALDFHMTNFEQGWLRFTDGMMKTDDGGAHWQETKAGIPDEPAQGKEVTDAAMLGLLDPGKNQPLASLTVGAKTYAVKQSQFLTDQIGWALVEGADELKTPLLVTADGGQTWNDEVTSSTRTAMLEEKERLQKLQKEAALYANADIAKLTLRAEWALLPDTSAPGDVVLVRRNKPGKIEWQGKTYTLQPFGAGYFTYLPITMQAKPGKYPIGDRTLTIQAKKFDTQYLKVTEQMESMKQDTGRIQADQKKIDLARSKSEPAFLFSGPFVQPVEGILTTPYGYTRYVNGKYDSSHMAIDLAAKEGTPIKATNDGVVALAESLYLTGNSIYIDHGMGLFSQYAHLSELRVKAGDRVKQGDIIGLVGTTGFSTGPHLHFTFWAHNVQVNPDLFFKTTPFQWVKASDGK